MLSKSTEVLIYLEHRGMVSSEELRKWHKSSLRGIIGKLEAQSLIDKITKSAKVYYKLSDRGLTYLDKYLENLHKKNPSSNKWLVVIFSIPESDRSTRDRFRRYMQKMGFGNIFKSAWISVSSPGLSEKVTDKARSLEILNNLVILDCSGTPNENRKIVNNVWNLKSIAKKYTSYISTSKNIINKIKKSKDPSYEAKKIIFDLAILSGEDPNLPEALLPADWPKQKALAIYKEIRNKII